MDEVCEVLKTSRPPFDDNLISVVCSNKITGDVLIDVNEQDLRELGVAAFGDRKRLLQLVAQESVLLKPRRKSVLTRDGSTDNHSFNGCSESKEEVRDYFLKDR